MSNASSCLPAGTVIRVQSGLSRRRTKHAHQFEYEHMLKSTPLGKEAKVKVEGEEDEEEPPHKKQNREAPPDMATSSSPSGTANNTTATSKSTLSKLTDELDMTLSSTTDKNRQRQIRDCVKEKIFRLVKFIHVPTQMMFDDHPDSICGMVIDACHLTELSEGHKMNFWHNIKTLVVRCHTHLRNNYIKGVQIAYLGK